VHYKPEHIVPTVKAYIPGQGTDLIKKGFLTGKFFANQMLFVIHNLKHGMKKGGQEIES